MLLWWYMSNHHEFLNSCHSYWTSSTLVKSHQTSNWRNNTDYKTGLQFDKRILIEGCPQNCLILGGSALQFEMSTYRIITCSHSPPQRSLAKWKWKLMSKCWVAEETFLGPNPWTGEWPHGSVVTLMYIQTSHTKSSSAVTRNHRIASELSHFPTFSQLWNFVMT